MIPTFARKPLGVIDGTIWRKPNRFDIFKERIIGWYLVKGSNDIEYIQPRWLRWVRNKIAAIV